MASASLKLQRSYSQRENQVMLFPATSTRLISDAVSHMYFKDFGHPSIFNVFPFTFARERLVQEVRCSIPRTSMVSFSHRSFPEIICSVVSSPIYVITNACFGVTISEPCSTKFSTILICLISSWESTPSPLIS